MSESTGRARQGHNSRLFDPRIRRPYWLVHCQADPSSSSLSAPILADDVNSAQRGCALFGIRACGIRQPFNPFDTRIHDRSLFLFPPSTSIRVNRSAIRTCIGISSVKTCMCLPGSSSSGVLDTVEYFDNLCLRHSLCIGNLLYW